MILLSQSRDTLGAHLWTAEDAAKPWTTSASDRWMLFSVLGKHPFREKCIIHRWSTVFQFFTQYHATFCRRFFVPRGWCTFITEEYIKHANCIFLHVAHAVSFNENAVLDAMYHDYKKQRCSLLRMQFRKLHFLQIAFLYSSWLPIR